MTRTSIVRRNRSKRSPKSHDGGVRFRVPTHPPAFTAVPWYNLVLRIADPPASVLTTSIQAALATQLGVSFIASLANVRLQSVRVWGTLSSSNLTPLSVTVLDPAAASFASSLNLRVLEALIDYPDAVKRPAVGYKYPKAQREISLSVSNANPVVLLNIQGGGPNAVVYFHLQWRAGVSGATPADGLADSLEAASLDEDTVYVDRVVDRIDREYLTRDEDGRIVSYASLRAKNKK